MDTSFVSRAFQRFQSALSRDPETEQAFWGMLRLGLLVFIPLFTAWLGGILYELDRVNFAETAQQLQANNYFYRLLPTRLLELPVFIFSGPVIRYAILPFLASLCVLLAGSSFVRDIYELKRFSHAFQYVTASMFAGSYPEVTIDGGKQIVEEGQPNLIEAIGGPGYCRIQPGNAVLFRHLRQPSRASVTRIYFMSPFERIGLIASLDEQQGHLEELTTYTRDGISVKLTDVHFRYRIAPEMINGRPVRPSLQNPYPYSENAMNNMAYNLAVGENGLTPWSVAVRGLVVGAITDVINSHDIDFLTAPRQEGKNPRLSMQKEVFATGIQQGLANIGAELLWVDVGHIEIIEETVDDQRVSFWATDLLGDANIKLAYGKAKKEAYAERGRAEAQAEIIMSIANAFKDVDLGADPKTTLRKLLLARTAQVLDAFHTAHLEQQQPEGRSTKSESGK